MSYSSGWAGRSKSHRSWWVVWKCQRTWPFFTSSATIEELYLSSSSVRVPAKKSGVALPVGRYTRPSLAS
ncbi:hypothetical protein D3C77_771650 [compost metagenome]